MVARCCGACPNIKKDALKGGSFIGVNRWRLDREVGFLERTFKPEARHKMARFDETGLLGEAERSICPELEGHPSPLIGIHVEASLRETRRKIRC